MTSGPGRVIGLYGGSFDPVHRAHVEIARRALAQVPCDAVWFVPAARTPFKPAGAFATAAERVEMLEAVVVDEPGLGVCTVELERPGCRSVETVRVLAAEHPDVRWRWIMGEDSFDALPTWAEPEDFVRMASPVVQPRPGVEGARPTHFAGAEVTWLEGAPLDVSSTAIREAIARGRRAEGLVPAVRRIIEGKGLYRGETTT